MTLQVLNMEIQENLTPVTDLNQASSLVTRDLARASIGLKDAANLWAYVFDGTDTLPSDLIFQ